MVICARQTAHRLKTNIRNLEIFLTKKRGKNKHTCPMFDNKCLASSKRIKLCPRYYIFPIKQEDICDYNPWGLMSSGFILDDVIMNLFTFYTEQTTGSAKKVYFPKSRMIQLFCMKDLFKISHEK